MKFSSRAADYREDANKHGVAEFVIIYPNAVLLHAPDDIQSSKDFMTADAAGAPAGLSLAATDNPAVIPIRRRPSSEYEGAISVGRGTSNDIVLPYPSISKLHAYFTVDGGQLLLADTGSMNGTQVNGQRLRPKVPTAVPNAADVGFGWYHFLFLTPQGFHAFLLAKTP